uniref:INCENP_ARK-bind domain-containing protein n=1 Tax=Macrostomum lignano TaxID=282301 RepID=A0A1I8JRU7_9PLAT
QAIQGLRRRLRGRQEAATPHRPTVAGRKSSVDLPNSRMAASVTVAKDGSSKRPSPRKLPATPKTPASATSGGGAKASLMTKSMIDLPSAKKVCFATPNCSHSHAQVRTKQLFNSTAKSSKRRSSSRHVGLRNDLEATAFSSIDIGGGRQPRQVRSRSEQDSVVSVEPFSRRRRCRAEVAVGAGLKALRSGGPATRGGGSRRKLSSRGGIRDDTKQVSCCPTFDCRRKLSAVFEEQRRLHREKLETEKRADEERRQREEEFRRRRVEEQRRREEEPGSARRMRARREKLRNARRRQPPRRAAAEAQRLKEQEEADRQAREREERERQERLAAEEADRIERRKKLEAIMNEPLGGAAGSPTPDKQPTPAPAPAPTTNENVEAGQESDNEDGEDDQEEVGPGLPMTVSMPPALLSQELQAPVATPKPPPPPPPQSTLQPTVSTAATSATPVGGSPALSALAGRLKGTKAAEILARHSSQQNLAAAAAAASPAAAAPAAAAPPAAPAAEELLDGQLGDANGAESPAKEAEDDTRVVSDRPPAKSKSKARTTMGDGYGG